LERAKINESAKNHERAEVAESAIFLIERTNNSEVNTMKNNQLAQGDVLLIPLERVEGQLSEVPRRPQGKVALGRGV
jgi:hypothetical protein